MEGYGSLLTIRKTKELVLEEEKGLEGEIESTWTDKVESFDELGLKEELLRGIYGFGFTKPSAIQQRGILPLLEKHDTIAQAQSGTGKTGAFAISLLQLIDTEVEKLQGLILSPTRELVDQTSSVIEQLGRYMEVKVVACVGGTAVKQDIINLKKGVHVVVATPGRILDLIRKKIVNLDSVAIFVLDEADEMLSRGFKAQIQEVFSKLPSDIQVGLFSATMPKEMLEVTEEFMREPAKILVKKEELTLSGIQQYYVPIPEERNKFEVLCSIYKNLEIQQALIYCNSKRVVEKLTAEMRKNDFTVSSIHGEMNQTERSNLMKEFRTGVSRVLITTDLLARGIDVQQVSLVINYELPRKKETYIHRIGRSGRLGRKGVAINLIVPADSLFLKELQEHYQTEINLIPTDLALL